MAHRSSSSSSMDSGTVIPVLMVTSPLRAVQGSAASEKLVRMTPLVVKNAPYLEMDSMRRGKYSQRSWPRAMCVSRPAGSTYFSLTQYRRLPVEAESAAVEERARIVRLGPGGAGDGGGTGRLGRSDSQRACPARKSDIFAKCLTWRGTFERRHRVT